MKERGFSNQGNLLRINKVLITNQIEGRQKGIRYILWSMSRPACCSQRFLRTVGKSLKKRGVIQKIENSERQAWQESKL